MWLPCMDYMISFSDIPGLSTSTVKDEAAADEDDEEEMFVDASDGGATGSGSGGVTGSSTGGVAGNSGSPGGAAASPRGTKRKRGGGVATTPTKRESDGDVPSSKRGKMECKYGPKCYQTSKQHKEQFLHPWVSC